MISAFTPRPPPNETYCRNCECSGCQIAKERMIKDCERNTQEQMRNNLRDFSNLQWEKAGALCDYEDLHRNTSPGAVIPMPMLNAEKVPDEIGEDTDPRIWPVGKPKKSWVPWKFLGICLLIGGTLQLIGRACGRVV